MIKVQQKAKELNIQKCTSVHYLSNILCVAGLVASAGGALGHAAPSTDVIDAHLAVQGTIRFFIILYIVLAPLRSGLLMEYRNITCF